MVKAKCEAVADGNDGGQKIHEEVRFYVDGKLVKTVHLKDKKDWGSYELGQEYDVEPDAEQPVAPREPDSEPAPAEDEPALEPELES